MSMAEDEDVCSVPSQEFLGRGSSQFVAVRDVNGEPVEVDGEALFEARLAGDISVSVNRPHGRDSRKLVQDGSAAYIASVKD